MHITIETAGTVFAPVACDLMSISPKLANSTPEGPWAAQHERLRIQPDVLGELMADYDYQLKFVIAQPEDMEEVRALVRDIGCAAAPRDPDAGGHRRGGTARARRVAGGDLQGGRFPVQSAAACGSVREPARSVAGSHLVCGSDFFERGRSCLDRFQLFFAQRASATLHDAASALHEDPVEPRVGHGYGDVGQRAQEPQADGHIGFGVHAYLLEGRFQ